MKQINCYAWLIDTIRRNGEISHQDLSILWENEIKLSNHKPLNRSTFRRWRKDIQTQFGIIIGCRKYGDYRYYIENPENFDTCPYLAELSLGCLRRIKKEDIVDECEIRQDLVAGLFYFGKALKLHKDDDLHVGCWSARRELQYHIACQMNRAEIKYTVDHLKEWLQEGYTPAIECVVDLAIRDLSTVDISRRLLGLDDKEIVKLVSEYQDKAYLCLRLHLNNVAVRKFFFKKADDRDMEYTFHLADYLYRIGRYEKAFQYLTKINSDHYRSTMSEYLGLMYFYGRGIASDYDKARNYLEISASDSPEVVYALGEIYRYKGSLYNAVQLYRNFMISPYNNSKDRFYQKVRKEFTEIYSAYGITDWIIMTIRIHRNNRRCEFSVELPPYCRILIYWGEPESSMLIRYSGKTRCRHTFRHTYRNPGEYKIDFEVVCHNSIEAFEFSRYKNQLKCIDFKMCMGLRKLSIIGQCLDSLELPLSEYLYGLICRGNNIHSLDLSACPKLTHLDCSYNPVEELKLHKSSPLTAVCARHTKVQRTLLIDTLRSNRGGFCNALDYDSLIQTDMRLEYYFRCTSWDKTRKYLKNNLSHYYYHALSECDRAFHSLKEMALRNNRTPYEKGVLEIDDEYVSEDTICGHEEFFLVKEPWVVSLATKVRDTHNKEPWMRCEYTPPEYYVAYCLVNMIQNEIEMKSVRENIIRVPQNETGNNYLCDCNEN